MSALYADFKKFLKIAAFIYFIVLPVFFWMFDAGSKAKQLKAERHKEQSPAWFVKE